MTAGEWCRKERGEEREEDCVTVSQSLSTRATRRRQIRYEKAEYSRDLKAAYKTEQVRLDGE